MELINYFDLLKALSYIERVVKSDFSEKIYFTSYVRNMFWPTILYKDHALYRQSLLQCYFCIWPIVTVLSVWWRIKGKVHLLFDILLPPTTIVRFWIMYSYIWISCAFIFNLPKNVKEQKRLKIENYFKLTFFVKKKHINLYIYINITFVHVLF